MITKLNLYKESILVPRNIEGRKDKLKQQNIRILSQESITGDLSIDESYDFDKELYKFIKVKEINGNVNINLNYIPLWLENVVINGNFNCSGKYKLTTLKGCPKIINGDFVCAYNSLASLKYGPEFVKGNYMCYASKLKSLKGCSKKINGNFDCSNNKLTSLEYSPEFVSGSYWCNNNQEKFTNEYVKTLCDVKNTIWC